MSTITPISTKPFISIYVIWHPLLSTGKSIADAIYDHFRRNVFIDVGGGTGVSVQYRTVVPTGAVSPPAIDPSDAETTAIVALLDTNLVADPNWIAYVQACAHAANREGFGVRVFPIAMESSLTTKLSAPLNRVNFVRWDKWGSDVPTNIRRLLGSLTYELCRMLRHYLEHLKRPSTSPAALKRYLTPVRVFLSHSKHDVHGEAIANDIRNFINGDVDLAAFLDSKNIPPGTNFDDVLRHYVRVSAVIAIQTDSYSSREWCRREIIEAKRWCVPLVVCNCVSNEEQRGFPYLGNVPVLRLDPGAPTARIPELIARVLDEVFKYYLWRCRIFLGKRTGLQAVFLPRAPELISLIAAHIRSKYKRGRHVVVYPDPPLGLEEEELLHSVAPRLTFVSYTAWLAGLP